MKFTRVSETKPTMRALAKGQNQLHDCLETHREDTSLTLAAHGRDLKALKKALRIGERGETMATLRPWKAFLQQAGTLSSALVVAFAILRLVAAAWPQLGAIVHLILTTP